MQFDNKKFKANFNPHYKNNRSCTAQKINKSSQHIHRLFRNLIITSNNIEIKKSRQEALKNIHSKLRDIIVMVAHHMKKEISLTRSQIDAIAITEENINPKLKFLEDRLKAAIFQFDAWREFGSLEKFLDFSLLIFSQITFWEILDINAQKEIQKILFPHGVSYDPIKDCILSNNS